MGHRTKESKNATQLLEYYNIYSALPLSTTNWNNISAVTLPSSHKQRSFNNDDLSVLLEVYQILYPRADIALEKLSRTFKMCSTVQIFGLQYGSKKEHRSRRTARIIASWPEIDGKINTSSLKMTLGLVDHYFVHALLIEGEYKKFCFACVTWYMPSDNTIYSGLNPLLVISKQSILGGPSMKMRMKMEKKGTLSARSSSLFAYSYAVNIWGHAATTNILSTES